MSALAEAGVSMYPYPGLRPFEKEEADLFFGRREHVKHLVSKLERHRFLAVIGPSGCGKSSLIRAGLRPALESGSMRRVGPCWRTALMRPGDQPLSNLATVLLEPDALGLRMDDRGEELAFLGATLRRGPLGLVEALRYAELLEGTSLLVLVDQFEEIFRFHRLGGTTEANAFVDLLLASAAEPSARIYVVLTMRSDHLGNCTVFRGLPEAMNESQFLTPRLTRDQNHAAIVGPAEMFGVAIEADLVTRILNEMGTDPDQLPLMQHLLMRMWRRVTQGRVEDVGGGEATITMADYEAVGGLANALSNHVERIYRELPDAGSKRIAEVAFRNLTEITPDGQVVRRPAKVSEICAVAGASLEQVVPVLDEFRSEGRSLIMPPISEPLDPEKFVDISHESLIRQWRQLGDWTKDEEKARRTGRVVAGEMSKWQESGRDERALLHGLRLLEAEEWEKTHPHQVRPEERDFLEASRDQRDREARRQRLFTRLIGALAVVALILLVACFIALRAANIDRRGAVTAQRDAEEKRQQAVAAQQAEAKAAEQFRDQLKENVENRARGLAGASRRLLEQGDAAGALTLAVEARNAMRTPQGSFAPPKEVAEARLSALGSWKPEPSPSPLFHAGVQKVQAMAYSPDGRWLVTGGLGSFAQLWHLDGNSRRKPPVPLDGHAESVNMVAVSGHGPLVATLDHEGVIRLWRPKPAGSETMSVLLKEDKGQANVIALSPDGRWLAAGGKDCKVWLWDLTNPDLPVKPSAFDGHAAEIISLAFDPEGHRLATADFGGAIRVHDLSARDRARPSQVLNGHAGAVYSLAFSPPGDRLASAGGDGCFRLWDVPKDGPVEPGPPLYNHYIGGSPKAVTFSPDGGRLAVGDSFGRVQVWDAEKLQGAPFVLSGPRRPIGHLAFSPLKGRYLAARDEGGKICLWDVGEAVRQMISMSEANASPTAGEAGFAAPRLPAHLGGFAFHPDGRSLVTINGRGGLLSWDLSNLDESSPFDPFADRRSGYDWCRALLDGARVGSEGPSGGVAGRGGRLWKADAADTTAVPVFLARPSNATSGDNRQHVAAAAFGPDGHTVALADPDGTIKLWDTAASGASVSTVLGRTGPPVSALAFNPATVAGHRWLASGDHGGTVRLWDLAAGGPAITPIELPHGGEILSLAFSPDGRWLVTGPMGGPARAWDLKEGAPARPARPLGDAGPSTYALEFHPRDPNRLAQGNTRGEVLLWDLSDGQAEPGSRLLDKHEGEVTRLLFTPDGGRLISTSMAGAVRICYDPLEPNSRHAVLGRHPGAILCMGVSPDAGGRWLATGGDSGDVRLWRLDADASEPHLIPILGGRVIIDVAFASDGRSLAISADDKTLRVVGVDEAGPVPDSSLLFSGQDDVTTSLVLDAEGSLLIAAGPRGSARVRPLLWLAELDQLVDRLAVRNLTASEWDQHFTKQDYRKTFARLPVHHSLIDAARDLAKNGQKEEATRKLRRLVEIDPELAIDPKVEVNLATAEGIIENARRLARQGLKPKALALFRQAVALMPHIGIDPETEVDRAEAREAIDQLDKLIEDIRLMQIAHDAQGQYPAIPVDAGRSDVNSRLEDAQKRYKQAVEQAKSPRLGLIQDITWIGRRLKALENDRDARGLAAEGKLKESVEKFREAAKLDPGLYRYFPETEAQQVSFAIGKQADAEGRRLAAQGGKFEEAVKKLELAVKLSPVFYRYAPREEAQRISDPLAKQADAAGRRLAAQGKTEEAVPLFRRAHDLNPAEYAYDDPVNEARQVAAEGNLWQADNHLAQLPGFVNLGVRSGKYDLAESTFKEAKKLDPTLAYDPKDYVNRVRARVLVGQGQMTARALKQEDAVRKFREAKALDPDLELDPQWLARQLAGRVLLDQARSVAPRNQAGANDDLKKARELFADARPREPKRSFEIDLEKQVRLYTVLPGVVPNLGPGVGSAGRALCLQQRVEDAYSLYERACDIDPLLNVPADFWNNLSWFAALESADKSKKFEFAADLAVALDPSKMAYRDTRGLVRALRGDREGAIKDFEAYLWFSPNFKKRRERQQWIGLLRKGRPVEEIFTPAVLQRLRKESL